MQPVLTVFTRDFREIRQSAVFRILCIFTAAITVGAATGISVVLSRQTWIGQPEARPILELILGLVAYFIPLIVLISFIWAFASLPVIKEKINGNIENLLATPLSPREIWIAKCLAIFVPGYLISLVAAVLIILVVNFVVIIPAAGSGVMPSAVLLTGLLINPLLFFGMMAFILLFSLANNPDVAFIPSFFIGFGLMIGIPLLLATGAVDLGSWSFALWYLLGTAVMWAVVIYLLRLLRKENIVLSSKGD